MCIDKEIYLNPLTDFGFKKLFGEEANIDLLIAFINSILKLNITKLSFKKTEHLGRTELDRRVIFDLYCSDNNNNRFIVELQKVRQKYFKDRTIYYSTFPIQEQAIKGDKWDYKLTPVYCLGILDFTFDEDDKKDDQYFYEVDLREKKTNKIFYDKLKYIYICLPKFKLKDNQLTNDEEKWVYFLKNLSNIKEIPDSLKNEMFIKAFGIAEISKFDEQSYFEYQSSLKYYMDLKNSINTSYDEGLEKGKIEGQIEKSISHIIKLLTKKLGIIPKKIKDKIISCTDIVKLDEIIDKIFDIESFDQVNTILTK